ncbi:MAG TPA: hypothetical protein VEP66_19175 [Myxococcales bacterium]|nr:hypothetical protein [Myxococcales bacterium]
MRSRRELLATLTTVWLARAVHAATAAPAPLGEGLRERLRKLQESSRALAHREIQPIEWQRGAAEFCDGIDVQELCRAADFERVIARLPLLPRGTSAEAIQLLDGQAFTPKIFAMGKGRAIVPHGHVNMVSQHLVLRGEMRGRHYQRLRDEEKHLLVRPTIDRVFKTGDFSSISDQRDNVHWFVTTSERAYTLDAIVDNLDPGRPWRFHIDFVDPDRAIAAGDGALRLPRLELDECLQRYG